MFRTFTARRNRMQQHQQQTANLLQRSNRNSNSNTIVMPSNTCSSSTSAAASGENATSNTKAKANPPTKNSDINWNAVKFVPFSSSVDSSFWVRYCREKLETIHLNEDPIQLQASYAVATTSTTTTTTPTTTTNRCECSETSLLLSNSTQSSSTNNTTHTATRTMFPNEQVLVHGTLLGYNTLDAFQKVDKNAILHDAFAQHFFNHPNNNVELQVQTLLLVFADLKQHQVVYWFGFPALLTRPGKSITALTDEQQQRLGQVWKDAECTRLANSIHALRVQQQLQQQQQQGKPQGLFPYFIYDVSNNISNSNSNNKCLPLSLESYQSVVGSYCDNDDTAEEDQYLGNSILFGFFDPTSTSSPGDTSTTQSSNLSSMGWPMRNLVAFLCFHLNLGGKAVRILSYRTSRLRRIVTTTTTKNEENYNETSKKSDTQHSEDLHDNTNSILLTIRVPFKEDYDWNIKDNSNNNTSSTTTTTLTPKYKTTGWELNARFKPGPRSVNLKPLLDSNHLAVQAADLNLKLMKWRMLPDLQIDTLQSTKVLLLGSGTLGCSVARGLLGWGIRDFVFVDNGRVSYSNPVRQSLFTLEDCHYDNGSGRPKAVAAADALKTIAADVNSVGIHLSIPMPGHPESATAIQEAVATLDRLVQDCDVVFLLTDTRESRWLPTVMAAAQDKILINAAMGLDSWLVMRHGGGGGGGGGGRDTSCRGDGHRLGCYFCNDVVAPENSTKNRTLDQQCTVTRPGLAPITGSMAVELMVSLLHHPAGLSAPAPVGASAAFSPTASNASSALGIVPHQIRGSLVSYTMMIPTVPAFVHCTGCSAPVIEAYRQDKMGLVLKTCEAVDDSSFLEDLSGLTAFRTEATAKMDEIGEDWEDDE